MSNLFSMKRPCNSYSYVLVMYKIAAMTALLTVLGIFFAACFMTQVHTQRCLHGLPRFESGGPGYGVIPNEHQAIIPTYKFVCNQTCGNIAGWGIALSPKVGPQIYYIDSLDLQVWRPSPTLTNPTGAGCYSLVGNNRFTSLTLGTFLALVAPSPQDRIMYQPGDVLGFYLQLGTSVRPSSVVSDGVVVVTSPSRFTSELVWYGSVAPTKATSLVGSCAYSVGRNGALSLLSKAAPIISILTVTYPCSPSVRPQPTTMGCVLSSTSQSQHVHQSQLHGPWPAVSHLASNPACPPDTKLNRSRSRTIALSVGGMVVFLVLFTVILAASIALYMKHKKGTKEPEARPAIALSNNEAYGMNTLSLATTAGEEDAQALHADVDYTSKIEVEKNKAYGAGDDEREKTSRIYLHMYDYVS